MGLHYPILHFSALITIVWNIAVQYLLYVVINKYLLYIVIIMMIISCMLQLLLPPHFASLWLAIWCCWSSNCHVFEETHSLTVYLSLGNVLYWHALHNSCLLAIIFNFMALWNHKINSDLCGYVCSYIISWLSWHHNYAQ